jgi:intracellular multiplication protein IcmE
MSSEDDDNAPGGPPKPEKPESAAPKRGGKSLGDDLDPGFGDDLTDDFGGDPGFADFDQEENKNTLGYLWRNNPLVKAGSVLIIAALLIGVVIYFGMERKKPDQSVVSSGADITQAPGTEEVSPRIREAIEEVNQAEVERAQKEGDSAVPIQIDPPSAALPIPAEDQEQEDPLQKWRKLQEERLQKELDRTEVVEPAPPVDPGPNPAIAGLAEAMSQQMQSILERQGHNNFGYKIIADQDFIDSLNASSDEDFSDFSDSDFNENGGGGDFSDTGTILVPAGEIEYGQMITEANSDVQGPVLALIASGPLRGSRLIGSFAVQEEMLSLNFNTLVYKGQSIGIEAVALDPKTTLPALATDVDHRYLKRIVLPAAAAFVEGAASAISQSGLTTVSVEGSTVAEDSEEPDQKQQIASGIEEAGEEVRDLIDEEVDNTKVLVRIEKGTPLGILFLQPVTDEQVSAAP